MIRTIVIVVALSSAWTATAQTVPTPASAPPAAKAEPLTYRSAFADYRPWQEPEPLAWRAANASAAALGGHLGHVRGSVERMQAMPVAPAPQAAKPGAAR
jgi:hypothetical protein